MKSRKSLTMVLAVSLIALILPAAALAVDVSVECAYTAVDVVCEVYVDADTGTSTGGLRTSGVRLGYNTGDLTFTGGTVNTADWFFRDNGIDYPTPNSIVDNTTEPGNVDILVGKLDSGDTGAGATGPRVNVAQVTFSRNNGNAVVVTASEAHGGTPFVSIVDADGSVLVANIGATVGERGDTDGNGVIDFTDFFTVRNMIQNGSPYSVLADCQVGPTAVIDFSDFFCIRNKIMNP